MSESCRWCRAITSNGARSAATIAYKTTPIISDQNRFLALGLASSRPACQSRNRETRKFASAPKAGTPTCCHESLQASSHACLKIGCRSENGATASRETGTILLFSDSTIGQSLLSDKLESARLLG